MQCLSEDLEGTAQALVGQGFDADRRVECFHAMLRNLLSDTLQGIFAFMEKFTEYTGIVPKACDISKALVCCLTDVIEVLCSSPDSLLLNQKLGELVLKMGRAWGTADLPQVGCTGSRISSVVVSPHWASLIRQWRVKQSGLCRKTLR